MGILEQILETNQLLMEQIKNIQTELNVLKDMQKATRKNNDANEIVLKFKGNQRLSLSMSAVALGIKQTELVSEIEKGLIMPISETKRIFSASEIIRYKQARNKQNKYSITTTTKAKKRTSNIIKDDISEDAINRLIAEQEAS